MAERLQVILELTAGQYKREAREAATATGQIGNAAQGVTGRVTGLGGAIGKLGGVMAGVFAGAQVVGFAKDSIMAASDLEESINAVNVVFGDAAEGVLALGENSADSLGMSQQALNEFSVRFSAFAENIAGSSGRGVVEVVDEMTTRLADFASVHNVTMEEAATIAQSTLAGETEAFRRFGGDVSAAAVELKGLEMGLGSSSAELTEQEKILIRYQLFMEQTADTAGDFANTSDSTANTLRRLNARFTETKARIGQALMPAFKALLDVAEDTAPIFEDVALAVADLFTEIKPLIDGIGFLVSAYLDAKRAGEDWSGSTNPLIAGFGEYISNIGPMAVLTGNYTSAAQAAADVTQQRLSPSIKEAGEKLGDLSKNAEYMADASKDDLIPALEKVDDAASGVDRSLVDAKLAAIAAGEAFRNELAADYRAAAVSIDKTSKDMAVSLDEIEKRLLENIQDQAEFYSNLVILAEAGMDDLANFLRGQGSAVAGGAAADLVDDLGRALNLENVIETADRDARAVTDALANALESSKTRLLEVARSIGIDIGFMIRQGLLGTTFTTKDIINTLGAGLGAPGPIINAPTTSGGTSTTTTRRAFGGPIMAGESYMVGERGPELFVSGSSGGMLSNEMLRALSRPNGPVINVNHPNTGNLKQDLQYAALLANIATLN